VPAAVSQHWPLPHCASLVHAQASELHWCVLGSQHLPAVQSPSLWQHDWQEPLVQHSVDAPQSLS